MEGMEWRGISCVVISLNTCRKWRNIFKYLKYDNACVDDSTYSKAWIFKRISVSMYKIKRAKLGKLEFFFSKSRYI